MNETRVALYRRNNLGKPCIWEITLNKLANKLIIKHGIYSKNYLIDYINTNRKLEDEFNSRVNEKRKQGYKYLHELRDNCELPIGEIDTLNYLNTYLPQYRTTSDGIMLPMLAKTYDNSNNKLFKKSSYYLGQWKINGLRCFISAEHTPYDLFKPISLKFQSREGTIWKSLTSLEDYLLTFLPKDLLYKMVDEDYMLDGELYLPGHSVNEINHFVKDSTCKENKLIQYWCYDIAIQDTIQYSRDIIRQTFLGKFKYNFDKTTHLNNKERLICLPDVNVTNGEEAIEFRDSFIRAGFEGLILRNPDYEYQYGSRNLAMIKYKKSTDGKFKIIDIYPEGISRQNIPLFKLQNDINNETFEVHVGGSFNYQENILKNKEKYIGKFMYVEFGERSGVNQVPFHVKETYIIL